MASVLVRDREVSRERVSRLGLVWSHYRKRPAGMIALVTLLLLMVGSLVAPAISPWDTSTPNVVSNYTPFFGIDKVTGQMHVLGTDRAGLDLFTRLFAGGRSSLYVAMLAALVTVTLGWIVGALAGFYGGWVDTVLMRFTDFMLALPLLPMYLFGVHLFVTTTNTQKLLEQTLGGVTTTFIVFSLLGWMGIARLVRSSVLTLRSREFVEASRALGASNARILFTHLLPNSLPPVFVAGTFVVGDFIIWESILSYFQQGIIDPPVTSWGNMVVAGMPYVLDITDLNPSTDIKAYVFILPCLMIFLAVLSVNYIGDTLRDALDPRGSMMG